MNNPRCKHRENVFFASCFISLEDLAKSPFITPRHVHCQFSYQEYEQCQFIIQRQLVKVGITSLSFKDHDFVDLIGHTQ